MSPNLILLSGYPGVGKSTVAVELAKVLRYPIFDVDDILIEVENSFKIKDKDKKGRLAYNILKRLVSKTIHVGSSVIVDTPLTYKWLRDYFFQLKHDIPIKIHVIYCFCSDDVAVKRNENRILSNPKKYHDRDTVNFYRIKSNFESIDSIVDIRINTEKEISCNVSLVLDYLNEKA